MSQLALDFFTLFIVTGGVFFIAYLVTDLVFFTLAVREVVKNDRYEEWFAQPDHMKIGSGFRAYRKFCSRR